MAKSKNEYPTDTHMLNFVAKYVTEITEYCTDKEGVSCVQVEYYPKETSSCLAEREGKDPIQAFRACLQEAIRVTDAMNGNRDWDVLGTPKSKRNKT